MARKRNPKAAPAPEPRAKDKEKAFFFRVRPDEGTAAEIETILRSWARDNPKSLLDLEHDGAHFQSCEPNWDDSDNLHIFSATVLRFGSEPLPPTVEEGTAPEPLALAPNKGLGLTMCFAYEPTEGVAIVLYSQRGPKHSIIPAVLRALGFPHDCTATRICWDDIMQQLAGMGIATSYTLGVKGAFEAEELRPAGPSVYHALDFAKSTGGRNIVVHVTMGKDAGGLALPSLKQTIIKLREIGMSKISQLRLKAAESEDKEFQILDFVSARIQSEIEITRVGREMDRIKCQQALIESLKEVLPDIQKQKRS